VRLMSRLLLAQVLPLALVTIALASVLTLLVQMTTTLTDLSEGELGTLQKEGELHRAGWATDVSMRRAHAACLLGGSDAAAAKMVRERSQPLRAFLVPGRVFERASPLMVDIGRRYLALVDDLEPVSCARLAEPVMQARRSQLDEELTDAWIARLRELHDAVQRKEQEASALGTKAVVFGTLLALVGLVAALIFVRRISAGIRRPLLSLERLARRFGEGDFTMQVHPEGPLELQQLALALERMRRRLAEVDALKQGFLASVSHELRTPLSKIREALALLADGVVGPLTERQQRVVALGRVACEREIRLVTTLLDLSRLRAGTPLRPQAGIAIDSIISDAVADEKEDAQLRGVAIEVRNSGDPVVGIYDAVLCERAIANLMRNAVAVSKSGQRVLVHREQRAVDWRGHDGPHVVVRVVDDGPGVPDEIRSVVFDAFVTSAVEHSPKSIGVGLGLALAREVARAHGGELLLDERGAGTGSAFSLWLPSGTEGAAGAVAMPLARTVAPAQDGTAIAPSPPEGPPPS